MVCHYTHIWVFRGRRAVVRTVPRRAADDAAREYLGRNSGVRTSVYKGVREELIS